MTLPLLIDQINELNSKWSDNWTSVRQVFESCVQNLGQINDDDADASRKSNLITAGLAVANFIEHSCKKMARSGKEPNYHSRLHTAVVIRSLTALLLEQRRLNKKNSNNITREEILVLVAMAGHDAGHNGSRNAHVCQLESRSFRLIQPLLEAANCDERDIYAIKCIIWSTDPTLYARLHNGAKSTDDFDLNQPVWQAVICQEADILASSLPQFQKKLTMSLANEWRKLDPMSAEGVMSPGGRKYFLANIAKFSTPAAHSFGLPKLVDLQLSE
jgi:hypothetical protein|tara:strand:+ start:1692 stop:2510 length:819 start_codon:yes stop_codon:yes gene_type:complete